MENIQVCVRFRPITESKAPVDQHFTILPDKKHISTSQKSLYEFDSVFDEQTNNSQIFNTMVSSLLPNLVQGQNLAIFTYGQTSSGKTHTMFGTGSEKGITELAIFELFQLLEGKNYEVKISHLEIYNENIHDLLNPSNVNLRPLSNKNKTIVEGLVSFKVVTAHEAIEHFKKSISLRAVGDNKQNIQSSRSHSIFQVHLSVRNGQNLLLSELNLIDLAGSESLKNADKSTVRWNEGKSINQSLLTLIKCVNGLKKPKSFLACRDSQLTRVLQGSLNTKSGLVFICTVSAQCVAETLSTLNFGISAKKVKLKPDINELINYEEKNPEYEDVKEKLSIAYEEIERLKEKLHKKKEKIKEVPNSEEKVQIKDGEIWSRLASFEMENDFLREENEKLKEICKSLEIELNSNSRSHEFLIDDKENSSQVLISKFLFQNSTLKKNLDEVSENYNKILKENQILLNKTQHTNNNHWNTDDIFQGCKGECVKKLQILEQEKSELQTITKSLEHSLELQLENSVSVEEYESLQATYISCLKAKESQSIKLKTYEKNLLSSESELKDLKQELKKSESKISTLECQIGTIQSEKSNLEYCLKQKEENFELFRINTPSSKRFLKEFEDNSKNELELETLRNEYYKLNINYQDLLKVVHNKRSLTCENCFDKDGSSRSIEDLKEKNEYYEARIGQLMKQKSEILVEKTKCEEELKRKSDRILELMQENEILTKNSEKYHNGSEYSPNSNTYSTSSQIDDL